jgi:hypothetical protein
MQREPLAQLGIPARHLTECTQVRNTPCKGTGVYLCDHKPHSDRREDRLMVTHDHLIGTDPNTGGNLLRGKLPPQRERLGRMQPPADNPITLPFKLHFDDTSGHLQSNKRLRPRNRSRKYDGSADGGVACERHFCRPVENPHTGGILRVSWREDKGGLAKVQLSGEQLHLGAGQALCFWKHGQGIAAEPPLGEYVNSFEAVSHWDRPLGN